MKKLISFLLLASITAASLAACASEKTVDAAVISTAAQTTAEEVTTAAETADTRYISDLPATYDLGGFELKVLNRPPFTTTLNTFWVKEQSGESINDAVYERNSKICEKYGFEIKQTEDANAAYTLKSMVLAGDKTYYAAIDQQSIFTGMVFSDVFYNVYELPNVNFDKLYWNQDAAETMSLNGTLFYLMGDLLIADEDVTMITVYNTALAADLGIKENMYDTVWDGKWTMAKMLSLAKSGAADLNGDGKFTLDDRFGLFYADNSAAAPYFGAAEISFVSKNNSGAPEFSFDREKAAKVFEMFKKLFNTPGESYNWGLIKENGAAVIAGMLSNKQMLLQNGILSFARRSLRDVECNFGFMPMPKYDEKQEDYSTIQNFVVGMPMVVPKSNPELDKTGFALEALCAASAPVTDTYINVCLASKYTRDAESFEMIKLALQNINIDLAYVYNWGGFSAQLTKSIMDGNAEFASFVASYEDKVKAEIASSMEKLK